MRILTVSVVLVLLISTSLYVSARSASGGLAQRVAELEARVAALTAALDETQEILQFVHVEPGELNDLIGPHWIIEGANVHVRSGSGITRDACATLAPDHPTGESFTGLGDLLVGDDEQFGVGPPCPGS